jgi:hypothetical protein
VGHAWREEPRQQRPVDLADELSTEDWIAIVTGTAPPGAPEDPRSDEEIAAELEKMNPAPRQARVNRLAAMTTNLSPQQVRDFLDRAERAEADAALAQMDRARARQREELAAIDNEVYQQVSHRYRLSPAPSCPFRYGMGQDLVLSYPIRDRGGPVGDLDQSHLDVSYPPTFVSSDTQAEPTRDGDVPGPRRVLDDLAVVPSRGDSEPSPVGRSTDRRPAGCGCGYKAVGYRPGEPEPGDPGLYPHCGYSRGEPNSGEPTAGDPSPGRSRRREIPASEIPAGSLPDLGGSVGTSPSRRVRDFPGAGDLPAHETAGPVPT